MAAPEDKRKPGEQPAQPTQQQPGGSPSGGEDKPKQYVSPGPIAPREYYPNRIQQAAAQQPKYAGAKPTVATDYSKPKATVGLNLGEGAGYADAISELTRVAGHRYSEDEIRQAQRRAAGKRMVAGIGDISRALANIYFTTKGAPDAYKAIDGREERWGKEVADMRAVNKDADAALMALAKLREDRRHNEAMEGYYMTKEDNNHSWRENKATQDGKESDSRIDKNKAEEGRANAIANYYDTRSQYLKDITDSVIAKNQSAADANKARALKAYHNESTGEYKLEYIDPDTGEQVVENFGKNRKSMEDRAYQLADRMNINTRVSTGNGRWADMKPAQVVGKVQANQSGKTNAATQGGNTGSSNNSGKTMPGVGGKKSGNSGKSGGDDKTMPGVKK